MKSTISTTLVLALIGAGSLAVPGHAQSQKALIAKKKAKLQKPFLENAKWFTDYDKALAAATKSQKVLFTYFTRSYSP